MSSFSSFIKTQRFQDSRLSVYVSGRPFGVPLMIHAVVLQNAIKKSCLVCVKSEKYAFWITLRVIQSMRGGEAKLCTFLYHAR